MRTFTIISHGETTTELDADRMTIDNGIVAFWEGAEELVGLTRDWTVISSSPPCSTTEAEPDELPELPNPHDSFPTESAVVNPDVIGAVADPQTSEPDAPGVSNESEPEPALTDDVDATPPENPPTSESTGTDDLPAEEGGDSTPFEMDQLALRISTAFANNRRKPILDEVVAMWTQEGIPSNLTAQTLEQRRRTLQFLEERGAAT